MTCTTQQTDLNHAALPDVAAAVRVAEPVAQRIVDNRPYNDPTDITVVPGVGPGTPVDWDRLCVTPVIRAPGELVPAVGADACVPGDSRVNLATAPPAVLARGRKDGGLGLGAPVAARLIERRTAHPLPSVRLAAIIAGIGDGGLKQWGERTCLTPAPFIARTPAGARYAADLFSSDTSRSLTLSSSTGAPLRLTVPAGVLVDPVAWAVVIDSPETYDWQEDRADFHIYGTWQAPGHLVYVTVPSKPAPLPTLAPAIAHVPAIGGQAQFLVGDAIAVDAQAGTTTAALSSLSPVEASFVPQLYISAPTATPITPEQAANALNFMGQVLDLRTEAPTCPSSTASYQRTETVSGYFADNGEMLYCTWVSGTDGKMRARFALNRNFVASFNADTAGSRFIGNPGAPSTPVGWAIQTVFGVGNSPIGRMGIAPGGTFEMELDPTSSSMTVDVVPNRLATAAHVLAERILEALLPVNKQTLNFAKGAVQCAYPMITSGLYRDGMSSAQAVGDLWSCIEPFLPDALIGIGKAAAGKALAAALLVTDGAVAIIDYLDLRVQQFVASFTGNDAIKVTYAVATPPRPLTDAFGRPYHDGCVTLRFDPRVGASWNVDESCQQAFYGSPIPPPSGSNPPPGEPHRPSGLGRTDGTIGDLSNGMTDVLVKLDDGRRGLAHDGSFYLVQNDAVWDCLSDTYPTYWTMQTGKFGTWFSHGTKDSIGYCAPQTVGRWLHENLRNWIVRDPAGRAVFLDGAGVVHPIRDGGCFLQLANRYLVQDHVLDPYVGTTGGLTFVNRPVGADACG